MEFGSVPLSIYEFRKSVLISLICTNDFELLYGVWGRKGDAWEEAIARLCSPWHS